MSAETEQNGIRGLDMQLTETPTARSLADILALMLTAPNDERALGAFDLAWKIADRLQNEGKLELFVEGDDWQEVKEQAIKIANEWREDPEAE